MSALPLGARPSRPPRDEAVAGANGSITLDILGGIVPPNISTRFIYVAAGVVLQVKNSGGATSPTLLKSQLVLVQGETRRAWCRNASTAQLPQVLDDLYAAAGAVPDLGVSMGAGRASSSGHPRARKTQ